MTALLGILLSATAMAGALETSAKWTADNGESISLGKWKGKRVVFAMFYPRCTSACPIILAKLRKIQSQLDQKHENAEFVLVSLDAAEESAERLKTYRGQAGLTRENWHFLFGSDNNVRYLSQLVNVRYWRNPKTKTISHDNVILLFGEDGTVSHRLEGLDASLEKLF
ncbi:MAG: SCO family protein [Bdellovibrionota bacterium]